jgi:peptidoglycan/xylan/chitin deacetylase (PgdA/CDA1 family)
VPNRSESPAAPFLFSVDLEDVRDMIPGGALHREAVPGSTLRYLDWLDRARAACTFFVVGRTAASYPDLMREIIRRGHEIACHTQSHRPLRELGREGLRIDLERNIESLVRCGASEIRGFRAPIFSLTGETRWAYGVLRGLGIDYSSSVLPARSPLFGWPGFGGERVIEGVREIPVSVGPRPLAVPFAGGVYLRCLPRPILRRLLDRAARRGEPLVGYVHPYDIDTRQELFIHPHLGGIRFLNRLMYVNRDRVFERLDEVLRRGFRIVTYRRYAAAQEGAAVAAGEAA